MRRNIFRDCTGASRASELSMTTEEGRRRKSGQLSTKIFLENVPITVEIFEFLHERSIGIFATVSKSFSNQFGDSSDVSNIKAKKSEKKFIFYLHRLTALVIIGA